MNQLKEHLFPKFPIHQVLSLILAQQLIVVKMLVHLIRIELNYPPRQGKNRIAYKNNLLKLMKILNPKHHLQTLKLQETP